MADNDKKAKKLKVREPVQVYLTLNDRKLLREVALAAGVSGAEVLRRGLRRMAGEILSDRSPAMRLLEEMNAADWPDVPADAGRNHDKYLAEATYPDAKPRRRRR
jgi:hypothetical protein